MSSVKGEFDIAGTESRTTGMVGNNPRGSREITETSNFSELDRSEKGGWLSVLAHRLIVLTCRVPLFLNNHFIGCTAFSAMLSQFLRIHSLALATWSSTGRTP